MSAARRRLLGDLRPRHRLRQPLHAWPRSARIAERVAPGDRVLELGCATGLMTAAPGRRRRPGHGRRPLGRLPATAPARAAWPTARASSRPASRSPAGSEPTGDGLRPRARLQPDPRAAPTPVALLAGAPRRAGAERAGAPDAPEPRLDPPPGGARDGPHRRRARGLRARRTATAPSALWDADELAALAREAGLGGRAREGVMLKPLPNGMMAELPAEVLDGFERAARHLPAHCAMNLPWCSCPWLSALRCVVVGGSDRRASCAADARLRRGRRPVDLLLPRRGVGGGFAPAARSAAAAWAWACACWRSTARTPATPPPLADYRAGADGHAPFVRRVAEWVGELCWARACARPTTRDVARRAPAWTTSTSRSTWTASRGAAPRRGAPAPPPRPARPGRARRRRRRARATDTTCARCRWRRPRARNHGADLPRALHRADVRQDPPRRRRRRARRPAAQGVDAALPPAHARARRRRAPTGYRPRRPFHTVEPGGVGALVDALLARIRARARRPGDRRPAAWCAPSAAAAAPRARVRRRARSWTRGGPSLGAGAQELFAAVGAGYDAPAPPHVDRLGRGGRARRRWRCPAWSTSRTPTSPPSASARATTAAPGPPRADARAAPRPARRRGWPPPSRRAVVEAGLVARGRAGRAWSTALARPGVARSRRRGAGRRSRRRARGFRTPRLDAEVVGGAAAFGADSFNEQVIQGLRAEEATA